MTTTGDSVELTISLHWVAIDILLFIGVLVGFNPALEGQEFNIGVPKVENFMPTEYQAGTQCWDIEITKTGLCFVANNDGLLVFDGQKWKKYPLENKTIARSVALDSIGNVYVGGQDELGRLIREEDGEMNYATFMDFIPEEKKQLEDIWNIEIIGHTLIFQTKSKIFRLHEGHFEEVYSGNTISKLKRYGHTFYFYDENKGLYYVGDEGTTKRMKLDRPFTGMQVTDFVLTDSGGLLVLTERAGIFLVKDGQISPWQNNAHDFFINNFILSGLKLRDGNIAIGTRLGGLVILDPQGKAIYKIDKRSGLQNNSINCIEEDEWSNLWLGTYYGIDKVNYGTGLSYFYPDGELEGAIYDIDSWNGYWWFATSNGLYSLPQRQYYNPFEKKQFKYIAESSGQVYSLDIIGGRLLMGHNRGAYIVQKDGSLRHIPEVQGVWKFIPLEDDKVVMGTYRGLYILDFEMGSNYTLTKIPNFEESARIIIKDNAGHLWVSHPYRGVFKIVFNDDYSKSNVIRYKKDKGFDTEKENYIFAIDGIPYLTNVKGVYVYNFQTDEFEEDAFWKKHINISGRVRSFYQKGDQVWYIGEKGLGYVDRSANGFSQEVVIKHLPVPYSYFVGGFENMYPIDEFNQFIFTNKGVIYNSYDPKAERESLKAYITDVRLTQYDSLLAQPVPERITRVVLPPKHNAIQLRFRNNGIHSDYFAGYSYLLEGQEASWSPFSLQNVKEYTNLSPGNYRFLLRAMDSKGFISDNTILEIKVLTPWYATVWAKFGYFFASLSILLLLFQIPRKKYQRSQQILVNKQKATEKEMEKIKQEKLQNELEFKNRELASNTLHLLQKNQTIVQISNQIEELLNKTTDTEVKKGLKSLRSVLRNDMRIEEDWENFSSHFDQVHNDFIKKLKEMYPQLTTKDHQLCAYLKMNLSTKDIAPLLNISIRGVEIGRYRLRKKLGLERDVNLNEFMDQL